MEGIPEQVFGCIGADGARGVAQYSCLQQTCSTATFPHFFKAFHTFRNDEQLAFCAHKRPEIIKCEAIRKKKNITIFTGILYHVKQLIVYVNNSNSKTRKCELQGIY